MALSVLSRSGGYNKVSIAIITGLKMKLVAVTGFSGLGTIMTKLISGLFMDFLRKRIHNCDLKNEVEYKQVYSGYNCGF